MRIRVLGQYVPVSIGVLALIEAARVPGAVCGGPHPLFRPPIRHLSHLEQDWVRCGRGLLFSVIVAICLLAFGLTARASAELGAFSCVWLRRWRSLRRHRRRLRPDPSLQLWRGVAHWPCSGPVARCSSRGWCLRRPSTRRFSRGACSSTAPGSAAAALANLRRSADVGGFLLAGSCARRARSRRFPRALLDPAATCASCGERLNVSEVWWPWMTGAGLSDPRGSRVPGSRGSTSRAPHFLERETGRCASTS